MQRVECRTIDEPDIPDALLASLTEGSGAALHIDLTHWVVVDEIATRPDGDLEYSYHDPLFGELSWPTTLHLAAAVFDSGVLAGTTRGTQAPVVGILETGRRRGFDFVRQPRADRPLPPALSPAGIAELLAAELSAMADGDASELVSPGIAFRTAFENGTAHVVRVRGTNESQRYIMVITPDGTAALIHERSGTLSRVVKRSSPASPLRRFLRRDALASRLDGLRIAVGDHDITLDRQSLSIEEELFWMPCDQSPSMLLPFYVVHQRDDNGADRVFWVRVDGFVYTQITSNLARA